MFVGEAISGGTAASARSAPDYSIDCERGIVSVRFGCQLGVQDIEHYAKALAADPLFRPSFSEIVDLTAVEDLQLNAASAVSLADRVDPFDLASKRAFIVKTPAQGNAARMHQILWCEKSIKIFASEAAAREWLETP